MLRIEGYNRVFRKDLIYKIVHKLVSLKKELCRLSHICKYTHKK